MRNPNRLVGVAFVLILVVGVLVWNREEQQTGGGRDAVGQAPIQKAAQPRVTSQAAAVHPAVPASPALPSVFPRPAAPDAVSRFKDWTERFLAAGPAQRAALQSEGLRLAEARKPAMLDLMRTHPGRAVSETLPYEVRKALPPEFDSLVERRVQGMARIDRTMHEFSQDPGPWEIETRYRVQLDGVTYSPAYLDYRRQLARPATATPVQAVTLDGMVALSDSPARVLDNAEAADAALAGSLDPHASCAICGKSSPSALPARVVALGSRLVATCSEDHANDLLEKADVALGAGSPSLADAGGGTPPTATGVLPRQLWATQGRLKLLFMRVSFPDDPRDPISLPQAYTVLDEANQWYRQASYNLVQLMPTVTPLLVLPRPAAFYGFDGASTPGFFTEGGELLLQDTRRVAREAGYDFQDYDLDMIALDPIDFSWWLPWAGIAHAFSGRGVLLQQITTKVVVHELGHNFGLRHANFSDTSGRQGMPDTRNTPDTTVETDSAYGQDAVLKAGFYTDPSADPYFDVSYGDPTDWMGIQGNDITTQFSSLMKYNLGWLPRDRVKQVTASGTNRLYSFDVSDLKLNRSYALRIRKDPDWGATKPMRSYWLDHRSLAPSNAWISQAAMVYWTPYYSAAADKAGSVLLDMTPGTPVDQADAGLVLGHTFSDTEANIHITPVSKGIDGTDEWLDIVVNFGPFPSNRPPTFQLAADRIAVNPGQPIVFTASNATDPDGDVLAYRWDFSDGTFGANSTSVSKSWPIEGEYVVRCEVSDMKGGYASSHMMVTVGTNTALHVTGRVIDTTGNPVANARVFVLGSDFGVDFTDTDGRYMIAGITSSSAVTNSAYIYGYETRPLNFENPSPIGSMNGAQMDHLASPLPVISVTTTAQADERGLRPGTFHVTRSGPLDNTVAVPVFYGGTATSGKDYKKPIDLLVFTNGVSSLDIPIVPLTDTLSEGTETVVLQLLLATNLDRIVYAVTNDGTNDILLSVTNSWPVPGWELRVDNGAKVYHQTFCPYVLGTPSATLSIADQATPPVPTITATLVDELALETGNDEALIVVSRNAAFDSPLSVQYTVAGTAQNGIDYEWLPGVVDFPAGVKDQVLIIRAIDDGLVEGDETVTIAMTPGTGYQTNGAPAITAIIVDNDLPTVSVVAERAVTLEPPAIASSGLFVITRSGDISQPLQVNYLLAGSATNGADFKSLPGSVTIPAGTDVATVAIEPLADALVEPAETVVLQLSSSTAYNVGNPSSGTVTIHDASVNIVSIDTARSALTVAEGGAVGQIVLLRVGDLSRPLTVNYGLGGMIDPGADLSSIGISTTFAAQASNAVVVLNPINDPYPEWPEDLYFTLLPGSGYLLRSPTSIDTVLTDNEQSGLPLVEFVTTESSVPESLGGDKLPWQIPVRISGQRALTDPPVIVEYEVRAASALLPKDYQFPQYPLLSRGWFVFDNALTGYLYTNLAVSVYDNTNRNDDRFVLIALKYPLLVTTNTHDVTNPPVPPATQPVVSTVTNYVVVSTNFALGPKAVHRLNILDDDAGTVTVSASKPTAYEEGKVAGQFTFLRNGPLDRSLAFRVSYSGTASPVVDYQPLPTELTFPAGVSNLLVDVSPVDDATLEPVESVHANIVWVDHGVVGTSGTADVLIVDNDGTIEFTTHTYDVQETAGHVDIPVHRTGDLAYSQSVHYHFVVESATPGQDYQGTDGVLTFAPGESEGSVPVEIIDDTLPELTETFRIVLSDLSSGVPLVGQTEAVVRILNDDVGYFFATNQFTVIEYEGAASITILRAGATNTAGSVEFIATNGTATAGADFTAVDQVVSFPAGVTSVVVSVTVTNDVLLEGDETVTLSLTQVDGQGGVDPGPTTLTIRDDESVLEFSQADYRVNENAGTAVFAIRRRGATLNALTVNYATVNGTAAAGSEFVAASGIASFLGDAFLRDTNGTGALVFRAGDTQALVSVSILDDTLGEPSKSFGLALSTPKVAGAVRPAGTVSLGVNSNATVTILDDELPGNRDALYANGINPNGPVNTVGVQPSGRMVFGGDFTEVSDYTLRHVARLTVHGDLDTGFNPGVGSDGTVLGSAIQPDGRILMAGSFTRVGGTLRSGVARLDADGELDGTFDPGTGANAAVRAVALEEGGTVLLGGDFTRFANVNRGRLARVDNTGVLDGLFAPSFQGSIYALAVQNDGRILVGGSISNANATRVSGLVRLNADGTLDRSFSIGTGFAGGPVYALALQADGGILVGGGFTNLNGTAVPYLARLLPDGTRDPLFQSGAGPNGAVRALGVHSSGRIYLGGEFTQFDGVSRNRFARLRTDGGLDLQFATGDGADATVRTLAVLPNSAVLLGGEFTSINGNPSFRVARVHGDEKLSLSGVEFTSALTTVDEGAGKVTLTLRRTGDASVAFTAHVTTVAQGSTATAGQDYVATNATVTFAAGVSQQTFSIVILDDAVVEQTESIQVKIDAASDGIDLGGQVTTVVQIVDNEVSVGLSSATYTVSEGAGNAEITVTRQGKAAGPASVVLSTADGTAIAGQDYTATTLTVNFTGSETSRKVLIPILDDTLSESSETFTVNLSSPSEGMVISLATATVTITDNDADRIVYVASALTADGNSNGAADPGETTTLSIALRNAGSSATTNLVATLVASNNITPGANPVATYGPMPGNGAPVSRSFTFSNSGVSGTTLNLVLQLKDGGRDLGTVLVPLPIGEQSLSYRSDAPIVINDHGTASPYPSSILVNGVSGIPTRFTVTLDGFSHTSPSDVDMLLVAPDGEKSVILSDVGGTVPASDLVITLSDAAATVLPAGGGLSSGVFRPVNYVNNDVFDAPAPAGPYPRSDLQFTLPDPNGTWSLYILDDTTGDSGVLQNGWKLNIFTSGRIASVTDVGVAITPSGDPVTLGQNLTYTVRVSNNGPGAATAVGLRQVIPEGVTFVSATGGATFSAGVLTATIPTLAVGSSVEYVVVVKPTAVGTVATSATVSSTEKDVYAANDSATLTTAVNAPVVSVPLAITRGANTVTLSWPINGAGVLESSPDLSANSWSPVAASPSQAGSVWTITLSATNGVRFYRLRAP